MRKFFIKSILFLFAFAIINIAYLVLIQRFDWNFSKRIDALNLKNPKNNLLVLGNSLAMDGIDTKYLSENGYSAYNLALGGSSLQTNLIQLQEYLTMYEYKPKVVILGLGSFVDTSFDKKGLVNPIVDFTRQSRENFTFKDIPLLKFKWLFSEQLKKIFSKQHRNAYIEHGQLRFSKTVSDNTILPKNLKFSFDKYLSSKALKSIINLCNKYSIKLIIIEMPGYKNTRHNERIDCHVIDKELRNGFLYDYNYVEFGNIFNEYEDWIGNSHLNEYGAKKFTKHILRLLEEVNTGNCQCK